jgi:RimJ/RimL family protein N-acetyltransferase
MSDNIFYNKLQETKNCDGIDIIKFPIDDNIAKLSVVDNSDDTIRLLTEWRNEFFDAYFDKFTATEDRTKKWLKEQVMEKADRILFIISIDGKKIGHIGVNRYIQKNNSAAIDNVLRGIRKDYPGLMKNASIAIMKWMFDELGLTKITFEAWSDNYKAINLYTSLVGFRLVSKIPFRRSFTDEGWEWIKMTLKTDDDYGQRYILRGEIKPEEFYELHRESINNIEFEKK